MTFFVHGLDSHFRSVCEFYPKNSQVAQLYERDLPGRKIVICRLSAGIELVVNSDIGLIGLGQK